MSESELILCENGGCEELFVKKTHNQIYHSAECCRQATNKRIMEKYYTNRDRRKGKVRLCKTCHATKLSRYNESDHCASCAARSEEEKNSSVADMMRNSSVVWSL